MKVLDSILFRAWQMGWLNKYDEHNKNTMTLNEYQEKAMTTCTESSMNFAYALTGLNAEVGEINDKVAKAIRKDEAVIASNELMVRCSESLEARKLTAGILAELGDVLWFVALLCKEEGWTMEEVAQMNLDKLADRVKRGVIIGEGDDR